MLMISTLISPETDEDASVAGGEETSAGAQSARWARS